MVFETMFSNCRSFYNIKQVDATGVDTGGRPRE